MGRNKERSPEGSMKVSSDYDRIIKQNNKIYQFWFENWLISHVPKLMFQPKWFQTSRDVKVGDIVLFLKHDSLLSKTFQYGMITNIEYGKDGIVRRVDVKYRNANENVNRSAKRSARDIVVIHDVDEIDIIEELGMIATNTNSNFQENESNK